MTNKTVKNTVFDKLRGFACGKMKEILKNLSLPAVIYAENLIGKGFGETKKQIATDFIINALPSFLLPFKSVIKRLLSDVLDLAVELAVEKLHSIQKSLPETV